MQTILSLGNALNHGTARGKLKRYHLLFHFHEAYVDRFRP